jgi:carboxyl-terminal processing protease
MTKTLSAAVAAIILAFAGMASAVDIGSTTAQPNAPAAVSKDTPAEPTAPAAPAAAAAPGDVSAVAAAQPAAAPEVRYAAVIMADPERAALTTSSDDLRMIKLLLQDPMVGNSPLEELSLQSTDGDKSVEALAGSLQTREAGAAVAFFYVNGTLDAVAKEKGGDVLAQFPGKVKILIEDASTVSTEPAKPALAISIKSEDAGASVVSFRFSGPASADNAPAKQVTSVLRGEADDNRDKIVTLGEMVAALGIKSTVDAKVDLAALETMKVVKFRLPSEVVAAIGPEKSLELAGKYTKDERWVESYLVLREIRKQEVTDPLYKEYNEADLRNLAIEGRYDEDSRDENVKRDMAAGLDVIGDILLLADLHYVRDVDNRDLFAQGAQNLQYLLTNTKVVKELRPTATEGSRTEFADFLKDQTKHVYEQESLTTEDFQARVKRIAMESDATVKLPSGVVVSEFLYGIPAALDPHTDYIPGKQFKQFQADTMGHFGGLGIEITLEEVTFGKKVLTVVTPIDGTPSAEAGILPGDRIIAIGKQSTEGMKLETAVGQIRGPIGTSVTITITHKGDTTPFDVTLTRSDITLESIKGYAVDPETGQWNYMIDPANKIGYIRMTDFKEETPRDIERAIGMLEEEGMKGLVLDLRFNHGGLLTSGVKISDLFIDDGTIVSVRGAHTKPFVYKAHYFNTAKAFPMVVLINDQSASAAEILGGALQDHHRATLVGTESFGKGTVQTLYELERGESALKLTTAKYYTPNGVSIHRDEYAVAGGLTPDVLVPMTDEQNASLADVWHLRGLKKAARDRILDIEKELAKKNPDYKIDDPEAFKDPQLDRGLEILRGKIDQPGKTAVATGTLSSPAPGTN